MHAPAHAKRLPYGLVQVGFLDFIPQKGLPHSGPVLYDIAVLQSLSAIMRWEQREYLKTPSANGNARVHPEIEIRRPPRKQRPSTPLRGLYGYHLRLQDRS